MVVELAKDREDWREFARIRSTCGPRGVPVSTRTKSCLQPSNSAVRSRSRVRIVCPSPGSIAPIGDTTRSPNAACLTRFLILLTEESGDGASDWQAASLLVVGEGR